MKALIVVCAVFILVATTGCGAQLDSYVRGVQPPSIGPQPSIIPPPYQLEGEGKPGVRVSPGSVISSSSNLGMKAAVGLNQTVSSGTTVGARIGITRGKPQN